MDKDHPIFVITEPRIFIEPVFGTFALEEQQNCIDTREF